MASEIEGHPGRHQLGATALAARLSNERDPIGGPWRDLVRGPGVESPQGGPGGAETPGEAAGTGKGDYLRVFTALKDH